MEKVQIKIDINDVLGEMNTIDVCELAARLAEENLSPRELTQMAVENSCEDMEDVLSVVDDKDILRYMRTRGYELSRQVVN